jgi:hypothetical protein
LCAIWIAGCEREVDRPGQLIVTIDTDMALPDQVDHLYVRVEANGRTKFENDYEVGSRADPLMPATLNLVSYSESSEPVTVKIAGSKATEDGISWRTYREATMSIPQDRIARLHMPVQWLCKGQVEDATRNDTPFEKPQAKSTCDDGYACRAGRCEKSKIDSMRLPDYTPEDVFGGGKTAEEGSCFDTLGCMAQGRTVMPDADCRIPKPERKPINVALRVLNDGICDSSGLNCYVPLDHDEAEGWRERGDQLELPPAVCDKMREGTVRAVLVADACEPKTIAVPTCGPWSKVPKGDPGEYRPAGEVQPSATLLTMLPGGTGADRCCPLMAAGDKLYTCVCANASSATVFEIAPGPDPMPKSVGTLNPSDMRTQPLATSIFDGSLYWAAGREVRRTPLAGTNDLATGFGVPAPAALYETGSLLTDDANVYALASGGSSANDAAVQLFAIPRDGGGGPQAVPMGNTPVFQFDHDATGVFLTRDQDDELGATIRRTSSVVRIDKRSGVQTTVMPERTLELPSRERGGYIGVQVEDGSVFAIYEDADPSGFRAQLYAAPATGLSGDPMLVSDFLIDPALTRIRLLGVTDGQVILSRVELDAGSVASASVLAVPVTGGLPHVLADFDQDFPVDGFASDSDRMYWLNASGALYALPRSVLR